jgi:hypothetical protein
MQELLHYHFKCGPVLRLHSRRTLMPLVRHCFSCVGRAGTKRYMMRLTMPSPNNGPLMLFSKHHHADLDTI